LIILSLGIYPSHSAVQNAVITKLSIYVLANELESPLEGK